MTLWTSNQDPGSIAVSVVVPAFNEARTVDAHLRLLVDWLHGLPWTSELIVVVISPFPPVHAVRFSVTPTFTPWIVSWMLPYRR